MGGRGELHIERVEHVRRFVSQQLSIPLDDVTADTDVARLYEEESLLAVDFVLALEKESGIMLPDHLEGARSVREIAWVVERWRAAAVEVQGTASVPKH